MLEKLYVASGYVTESLKWATGPARAAVYLVSAHPKSAIAIWAVSLWAAVRFF